MIKFIIYAGIGALGYATVSGDISVDDYSKAFNFTKESIITTYDMGVSAYDKANEYFANDNATEVN